MKTSLRFLIWMSMGLLVVAGTAAAQSHQITPWRNHHAGAVTMSFDDGYQSQVDNAVPLLNARGLKATFFVTTGANEVSWDQWRQLAQQGHEIGSHTVTHPDLVGVTDTVLRYELSESQRVINLNIPSQSCVSFAYPYTDTNSHVQAVTSEYYIAGRVSWAGNEGGDFNFYYDLTPFWPWPAGLQFGQFKAVSFYDTAADGSVLTAALSLIDLKIDTAIQYNAWYCMYLHTIPSDSSYINYLTTLLDHIVAKDLWMAPYGEVARYMRERLASTLNVLSSDASSIQLNLTNSLNTTTYNEPLTIRSVVPSTWSRVTITQGSSSTSVNSTLENGDRIVYYDAVPNSGTIVLSPSQTQATLSSVSMSPAMLLGGTSSTGTVTLSGPAPTGGAVVALTSSNTAAAQVPASVTVAAGATTATFTATTSSVSLDTAVTITALYSSVSRTASLTVTAPLATLSSVSLSPTTVLGGVSSTGTVTLSGPAPTGGAVVALTSSNTAAAQVPASVTVVAGATTATFTAATSPVSSNATVTMTALYNSVSRTASLTVTPPGLGSVSVSPASVMGGTSSTGTVTLTGAAPTGGIVVTLTSSNTAAAQVPASVTVAAGATTATFTATTSSVASTTAVTITALYNSVSRTAALTVTPGAALSGVSMSPTSVVGGTSSTGTVTLSGPAPTGGAVVTLTSSNTAARPGAGVGDGGGRSDDGDLHGDDKLGDLLDSSDGHGPLQQCQPNGRLDGHGAGCRAQRREREPGFGCGRHLVDRDGDSERGRADGRRGGDADQLEHGGGPGAGVGDGGGRSDNGDLHGDDERGDLDDGGDDHGPLQ